MGNYRKLVGERIYLSPMSREHLNLFTKWLNDFVVTDYIGRSHAILTDELESEWFDRAQHKEECMLAIIKSENDEIIGNISLHQIDTINRCATLGILIGEAENRSKGYGTEAIRLLLDFAFNYLNLKNVALTVLSVNKRAIRCYEKVGFKEFGRRRECRFVNGKYYDQVNMDILADEFREEYIKNKEVR